MELQAPDAKRSLAEYLARYLDPQAFTGERKSKRNAQAAYNSRKLAMKQARAAIRFFSKPKNMERLARAIEDAAKSGAPA